MLIGIVGKKGAGKDTAAEGLLEMGFVNLKMADTLKDMLRALYACAQIPIEMVERKVEGDLKEVPCDILQGQTPRHAMQTLGTEWRNMIGRDLWTDIWRSRLEACAREGRPVVCTDIRFQHELDLLTELGGFAIRIERPDLFSTDGHISETEMLDLQVDVVLTNDGEKEDLQIAMTYLLTSGLLK